jgi:branched-chain amino acid transport system permease protein
VPQELTRLPAVRVARWTGAAIVAAAAIVYPFVVSTGQTYLAAVIVIQAILALSLVVLTGWTGQVSLGQFGLAAVGAVVAGAIAVRLGLSFWLAVPTACVVTCAIAILLGLPALRLPGLHLAVATFAFAAAVPDVLFNQKAFGWLLPSGQVHRPTLPFLNFEDERSMYFLCVVALTLAVLATRNIRRSRFGRILIGIRDNEANAQSAAISPLRMKLTAFGIAGVLAGLAGALLAFQQRGVAATNYGAQASIDVFVTAVIGGISSIFGPLLGSGVINGLRQALQGFPDIAVTIGPLMAIVILYIAPGGLMSLVARVRDGALRIIAQRNQIVVPSLFADMDPEALHLRLVPMALPNESIGLVRVTRRYDIGSLHADVRAQGSANGDAKALAAAARAAQGGED